MRRADEVRAEHKLDAITHYLLKAFPGAAILSHRENDEDYVLAVCSAALHDAHPPHRKDLSERGASHGGRLASAV
jgi:hypothetical protein